MANRHFSPHNGFQLVVRRRLPVHCIFRITTRLKGNRKYKCWTSGSPTDVAPTRRSTPLLQHTDHCSANVQGSRQNLNFTGSKKGEGGRRRRRGGRRVGRLFFSCNGACAHVCWRQPNGIKCCKHEPTHLQGSVLKF